LGDIEKKKAVRKGDLGKPPAKNNKKMRKIKQRSKIAVKLGGGPERKRD